MKGKRREKGDLLVIPEANTVPHPRTICIGRVIELDKERGK
jgi:hypothetical protein